MPKLKGYEQGCAGVQRGMTALGRCLPLFLPACLPGLPLPQNFLSSLFLFLPLFFFLSCLWCGHKIACLLYFLLFFSFSFYFWCNHKTPCGFLHFSCFVVYSYFDPCNKITKNHIFQFFSKWCFIMAEMIQLMPLRTLVCNLDINEDEPRKESTSMKRYTLVSVQKLTEKLDKETLTIYTNTKPSPVLISSKRVYQCSSSFSSKFLP